MSSNRPPLARCEDCGHPVADCLTKTRCRRCTKKYSDRLVRSARIRAEVLAALPPVLPVSDLAELEALNDQPITEERWERILRTEAYLFGPASSYR